MEQVRHRITPQFAELLGHNPNEMISGIALAEGLTNYMREQGMFIDEGENILEPDEALADLAGIDRVTTPFAITIAVLDRHTIGCKKLSHGDLEQIIRDADEEVEAYKYAVAVTMTFLLAENEENVDFEL